ncbi:hypothetical protein RRG08_049567, partial [Elysia crispata]
MAHRVRGLPKVKEYTRPKPRTHRRTRDKQVDILWVHRLSVLL